MFNTFQNFIQLLHFHNSINTEELSYEGTQVWFLSIISKSAAQNLISNDEYNINYLTIELNFKEYNLKKL